MLFRLFSATDAHASELLPKRIANALPSTDSTVDSIVNKLLDRKLLARPTYRAHVEDTTLGKSGLAMPRASTQGVQSFTRASPRVSRNSLSFGQLPRLSQGARDTNSGLDWQRSGWPLAARRGNVAVVIAPYQRVKAVNKTEDSSLSKLSTRLKTRTAQRQFLYEARAAALQSMVDRGEASSTEEAKRVWGARGRVAALQNMVDRGEAATLKEASERLGKQSMAVTVQNMVDRGEAATLEEAQELLGKQGYAVQAARNPLGSTGVAINIGVASALARGKYTRYPGVSWRKDTKKWRVRVRYEGKTVNLGSYETEEEAAQVHDNHVRMHGVSRPLHVPLEGELSSGAYRKKLEGQG
jgi:hypothetical protein